VNFRCLLLLFTVSNLGLLFIDGAVTDFPKHNAKRGKMFLFRQRVKVKLGKPVPGTWLKKQT